MRRMLRAVTRTAPGCQSRVSGGGEAGPMVSGPIHRHGAPAGNPIHPGMPPWGAAAAAPAAAPATPLQRKVILASSLGTVFEWYDFYLYGALASLIASRFFGGVEPSSAFVLALLAFAAGFVVRPIGALVFGRLGDRIGRKYTFLLTLIVMGLSTCMVGLLPTWDAIGTAAPVLLVGLRMLQGLALGGEYGGAATYVAEHAPAARRGLYTAWIQSTATLGLLLSLVVVALTRAALGEAAFVAWGWRVPFLLSVVLLVVGAWMRLSMTESPMFQALHHRGRTSAAPVAEAFGRWPQLRLALLALFGLVAGQAVVWYTGQVYALFFLEQVLRVDPQTTVVLVALALLVTAPCFLFFGALSDRIGRKPVIGAGLLLACVGFFPLFKALSLAAHPALAQAQASVVIVLRADPDSCGVQGNPVAREVDFTSGCDLARRALAQAGAHFSVEPLAAGARPELRIGSRTLQPPTATRVPGGHRLDNDSVRAVQHFRADVLRALQEAGYPGQAPPIPALGATWWQLLGVLVALGVIVAMVYGPTAATLVELFPTRIRYTSTSVPYHLGNGWFGGLMPSIAFAMVAGHGNVFHGLWYPVGVAALTFVVGMLLLPETRGRDIRG
jgi:MFS family permease